jgi:hypothetical protein
MKKGLRERKKREMKQDNGRKLVCMVSYEGKSTENKRIGFESAAVKAREK